MDQRLEEAINFVRTAWNQDPFDEARYLAECEYIIDNRSSLPFRIFINLPGGLGGNADEK